MECHDAANSTLAYMRYSKDRRSSVLCVFNFTPVPREGYRVGVEQPGYWREIVNTDSHYYGGSGMGNGGGVHSSDFAAQGRSHSIQITLPPLGAVFFRREQ